MEEAEINLRDYGQTKVGEALCNCFATKCIHMRHGGPALWMGSFLFQRQKKQHTLGCFVSALSTWLRSIAIESGCTVLANLQEQVQARHLTTFQRYVFDALPRAAMLRPIVAEFGRYVTLGVNPQNPEFVNNLLKRMPKGSKVISRQLLPWDMFRVEMVDKLELDSWREKGCESPVNDQKAVVELCKFGVPSDPQTFVTRAVKAGHPKDLMGQISDLLQETVLSNFHRPPHLLAKERIAFVKKYSDLATQLKAEELKLRYRMPDHIKELMRGKRLALWAKMLADLNYPGRGADQRHGGRVSPDRLDAEQWSVSPWCAAAYVDSRSVVSKFGFLQRQS